MDDLASFVGQTVVVRPFVTAPQGKLKNFLADILAPRVCVGCGEEGAWCCGWCAERVTMEQNAVCVGCGTLSRHAATCDRCRDGLRLRAVCAAAQYDDPIVQQLIHLTKYAPAADVAGAFALLVQRFAESATGRALREEIGADAIIIPVPLHWLRERGRGFNQSAIIAQQLAATGFGTVVGDVLRRKRTAPWNITPQTHLSRVKRLKNVADAFRCIRNRASVIRSRNVILVDDVVTTGATLSACARTLRPHAPRGIWGFALAREP